MAKSKIRIRMEAYDHSVLDASAAKIVDTVKRTDAKVSGPIPLPTKIEKYTVIRGPHIDKESREQFEIRTHKTPHYGRSERRDRGSLECTFGGRS